jgi:hypothetical protein
MRSQKGRPDQWRGTDLIDIDRNRRRQSWPLRDTTPPEAVDGDVARPDTPDARIRGSLAEVPTSGVHGVRDLERAGSDVDGDEPALVFGSQ